MFFFNVSNALYFTFYENVKYFAFIVNFSPLYTLIRIFTQNLNNIYIYDLDFTLLAYFVQ